MLFLGVFLSGLGLVAFSSAYTYQDCAVHWRVTDSALERALSEIAYGFPPYHAIGRGWSHASNSQGDTVLRTTYYSTPTIVGPIQRYCRTTPTVAATFRGSWDVSMWRAYGEYLNATIHLHVYDVTFTVEFSLDAAPGNSTFALRPESAIPVWRGGHGIRIISDLLDKYDYIIGYVAEFLFSVFATDLFTRFMKDSALQVLRVATENAQPFSI